MSELDFDADGHGWRSGWVTGSGRMTISPANRVNNGTDHCNWDLGSNQPAQLPEVHFGRLDTDLACKIERLEMLELYFFGNRSSDRGV